MQISGRAANWRNSETSVWYVESSLHQIAPGKSKGFVASAVAATGAWESLQRPGRGLRSSEAVQESVEIAGLTDGAPSGTVCPRLVRKGLSACGTGAFP
jgi:hypothetical protein